MKTLTWTTEKRNNWLVRGALVLTALLCTAATIEVRGAAAALGYLDVSPKWRSGIAALFVIPGLCWLLALLSFGRLGPALEHWWTAHTSGRRTGLAWLIFGAGLALFCVLAVGWQPNLTAGYFSRLFFLWLFGAAGAASLHRALPRRAGWAICILATGLIFGAGFKIAAYLPTINNNPFTLNWSETSNYFYSSLFVSQRLYGFATPLPFFSPGRALLGVAPFLAPAPQIWINRLWAALLWVGCTGLAAWLVNRRLKPGRAVAGGLFTLWAFLFLFQGPIYYELLLAAAPVLWLFNPHHFWRSLLVVGLASAWAGLTRVNWFPMPGALAALLYLLETPAGAGGWRYWIKPAAWAAGGTAAALAVFAGYGAISGNPTSTTGTALQSSLLWYRLLPSGTSGAGVLPTALFVALPALILLGLWWAGPGRRFNRWRKLGMVGILGAFFAGGLVVSTKIGGGSNIHNLDGFWLLLLVVSGALYFNRAPAEDALEQNGLKVPAWLTTALAAVPLMMALTQAGAGGLPPQNALDEFFGQMNGYIAGATQRGQEVLFIDNKQLLTFGHFPGAKMVTDYETVYMLEMAMTGNQAYFETFYQDLKNKRFAYIFANPQPTRLQDASESFAEENNAQISWIGKPLLCYYQVQYTWLALGVEVFTPRAGNVDCP